MREWCEANGLDPKKITGIDIVPDGVSTATVIVADYAKNVHGGFTLYTSELSNELAEIMKKESKAEPTKYVTVYLHNGKFERISQELFDMFEDKRTEAIKAAKAEGTVLVGEVGPELIEVAEAAREVLDTLGEDIELHVGELTTAAIQPSTSIYINDIHITINVGNK